MNQDMSVDGVYYSLKNAKIISTFLGKEHGCFTFWINIEYSGGSGQGAGGICLDDVGDSGRVGNARGMELLNKIMDVVGVTAWEDLPGKYVRVYWNHNGIGSIWNILEDNGVWFDQFIRGGQ